MMYLGRSVTLALLLMSVAVFPARAQTDSSGREDRTQEVLDQLKEIIRASEQDRRSNPATTKQLRDLVRRYDFPWRVSLLNDDFRDGDYTYNPRWSVTNGEFRVVRGSGLRSYFDAPVPQARRPASRRSDGSAIELLGDLLMGGREREVEPIPTNARSEAEIFTRVGITNAFVVKTELNARGYADRDTRFEFGPYQGEDRSSGYRLAYESGRKPSLTLLRLSPGRSAVIEMTDQEVNLADGNWHTIEWRRSSDGEMIVLLDNREVIKTVDRAHDYPFDGFGMINKGGEFEVRRVSVFGTQR
jgi:hypothetical protein